MSEELYKNRFLDDPIIIDETNDDLPDNEFIEQERKQNDFIKNEFRIGYNVDVLENNYLEFTLSYIPFDEITFVKLKNIGQENSISVISANPLLLTKWNYINFGITSDKRLFIQIVNEDYDFDNSKISKSSQIELPGVALEYFINIIVNDENKLNYETFLKMYDADVDNLYFRFPPILIGGIENQNKSSKFFKSTDIANIPDLIKKLKLQKGINNGFEDFQISTFRYFNKELNNNEKQDEYKIKKIKNSNLDIKKNCFIDLQFEEIDENQIDDLSGNANHAYLIGDMKIDIYNDGKEFEITEKDLPEIKNEEGPF